MHSHIAGKEMSDEFDPADCLPRMELRRDLGSVSNMGVYE